MAFGHMYAIVLGGVALCAWSVYNSGLTGLLSTLPEYLISAAIAMPLLKKIEVTEEKESSASEEQNTESAEDMVGTMALVYQNSCNSNISSLPTALLSISQVISRHFKTPIRLNKEEYREIVISVAEEHCIGCKEGGACAIEDIRPCIKAAERVAETLCEGKKISPSDLNTESELCHKAEIVAEQINEAAEREENERFMLSEQSENSEEYRLVSTLMSQLIADDEEERRVDNSLTAPLTHAAEECGLKNGVVRAFGKREKHIILAGEDESGTTITSFELRKSIERAAGVRLATPEYFKRGNMVLMECGTRKRLKASYATAGLAGRKNEVSGDTAICFESKNNRFYSLISDGMGSGELARETSAFVGEFIRGAAEIDSARETVIHMLNYSLLGRNEECSATVDLFELDLLNGEGMFLKSGAAPSFVKRESSIFRIRSQTAPIGLLRSIDAEKIRLEIKAGDHIIMLSDGISDTLEDAPWLLLLLGEPPVKNLQDYAALILNEAIRNVKVKDDMTVTVIRVEND